jgi:hypothetical protein
MSCSKNLAYIGAAILFILALPIVVFGLFYVWASFSAEAQSGWAMTGICTIGVGLLLVAAGVVLIWVMNRAQPASQNVTLKVDLPANVSMDTLKCKSCGGTLKSSDIQIVAGAPVVTCPYCNTTYQLTEEPKW